MKNFKVLIVDDDVEQLKIMVLIIEKYFPDYTIYQAINGSTAMQVLKKITPDIIISDWDMSEMNGIDLVRTIKNSPVISYIPVIIVSGVMVSASDLNIAFEAGAVDFVRKPINQIELVARMHSAILISTKQKELIREKENKIIESVAFTNEMNRFLRKLLNRVDTIGHKTECTEVASEAELLTAEIKNKISGIGWRDYSKSFSKVHPEFSKKMLEYFPGLTPAELELCEMVRLGLSTKELADIMCITSESMRVSRSRLRKKLNLPQEKNLQSYLASI